MYTEVINLTSDEDYTHSQVMQEIQQISSLQKNANAKKWSHKENQQRILSTSYKKINNLGMYISLQKINLRTQSTNMPISIFFHFQTT